MCFSDLLGLFHFVGGEDVKTKQAVWSFFGIQHKGTLLLPSGLGLLEKSPT